MGQSHRRAAERGGPPDDATERRPAMKHALGLTVLLVVMAVGISCGGKEPMMSGPGTLLVRLTSPHSGADSAIVLTITGPAALTSAAAGAGLRLFQQPLGGPPIT